MIQVNDFWAIHRKLHGTLELDHDQDIEQVIKNVLNDLGPRSIPRYSDIKVCVKINEKGLRSVLWELI